MILSPYVCLGRGLLSNQKLTIRIYRYARLNPMSPPFSIIAALTGLGAMPP